MKTAQRENYYILKAKIRNAVAQNDLDKLSRSIERLYNAGQLTVKGFASLDAHIMEKSISLEL